MSLLYLAVSITLAAAIPPLLLQQRVTEHSDSKEDSYAHPKIIWFIYSKELSEEAA